MTRALLLAVLTLAPAVGATCFSSPDCRLGCCESRGDGQKCFCSACCNAARDDRAQMYVDGDRVAVVYRFRVEFYRDHGLRPAFAGEDGLPRALRVADAGWGAPSFLDAAGRSVSPRPRSVREFSEGIYPVAPRSTRTKAFLVCTDPEWGVPKATMPAAGFCGALSIDGSEIFRLKDAEPAGIIREPLGLSTNADEAVFVLTKKRPDGGREVAGYRLWRKNKGSSTLSSDAPNVKTLIEKYEGALVLPSLETGTPAR